MPVKDQPTTDAGAAHHFTPLTGFIDFFVKIICCGDIGITGTPEDYAEKNWPEQKRQIVMEGNTEHKQS